MAAPETGDGGDVPPPLPPLAPGATKEDAANYLYWQQHGGEWADEYDQRKKWSVKYHAAELMLNEYVRNHAPLSVLEFGCGVGRHLKHLVQIPGVDVYGYDQSSTMVGQCLRWTGPAWLDEHVVVGRPTGRLPYPDGRFDLVYSSEVLVHVRPEDLDGVLSELLRICRGHVLHLEPAEHTAICATAHDGCWNHDLVAAYARLGRVCDLLPSGYTEHTPYRVVVGPQPRYTWSPSFLALLRRMESDLKPTLLAGLEVPALREQLARVEADLRAARDETRAAHHEYAVLFGKLSAVEREYAAARSTAELRASQLDTRVADLERECADLSRRAAAADAAAAELANQRANADAELPRLREAALAAERLAREREEFIHRAKTLLDM